jgi:thiol-disulfide isomerase/thioredoxin
MYKKYFFFTIFIVISITLLSCSKQQSSSEMKLSGPLAISNEVRVYPIAQVSPPVKGKATDFSWTNDGKKVKFSEVSKGKVVLLNFWGTWCGPCKRELPDILQISKSMSDKGLLVIGIALEKGDDQNANFTKVKSFAQKQGLTYINIIGNMEIIEAYGGIGSIPQTFIIDKDGKIIETMVGMRTKEEFLASINRVLK